MGTLYTEASFRPQVAALSDFPSSSQASNFSMVSFSLDCYTPFGINVLNTHFQAAFAIEPVMGGSTR